MLESIVLGAVQGVAEWLPVSSEAMIILVKNNFFASGMSFSELVSFAIFLHLGTVASVVVYYRKKLWKLCKDFCLYSKQSHEKKQYLNFIMITTAVSGVVGLGLIHAVESFEYLFHNEFIINNVVAGFLLITAGLLFFSEQQKKNQHVPLSRWRAVITGLFQGLAAIPGISRSGSTVAGMGLLGIDKMRALELSFMLSVPLVLMANVILNASEFLFFDIYKMVALSSAFIFGLLTIDILLRLVRQVRFSFVVMFFAVLLIIVNFIVG